MTLTNDFVNEQMTGLRKIQVALWDQGFATEASAVRDVRNALRLQRVNPNAPRTPTQLSRLFGSLSEAFGLITDDERYAFTRAVLGKRADEPVSWALANPACITVAEADRLQTVLDLING